jgi:2'-5' RNA ligase
VRARLFFALEPPDEVRAGVVAWQGSNDDPALRAVKPESLHFTLCFLGSRPESQVDEIAAALKPDLGAEVELSLEPDPKPLPARRPRLYALGAESSSAVALQGMLSRRLVEAGLHEPEARPFWPHLTVFKVRPQPRSKGRPREVETPPRRLPKTLLSPFHAVRIALYRSYLRSSGSHYVSLASLELPRPARTGAEKR